MLKRLGKTLRSQRFKHYGLCAWLAFVACARTNTQVHDPELVLDATTDDNLDLVEGNNDRSDAKASPKTPASKTANPTTSKTPTQNFKLNGSGKGGKQQLSCQTLLDRFGPLFLELQKLLPTSAASKPGAPNKALATKPLSAAERTATIYSSLLAARKSSQELCSTNSRIQVLDTILAAVNQHSGRIGLILPLTGPRAQSSAYIIEGMRLALQGSGRSFEQLFVVKDSAGSPTQAAQVFAELVLREQATLIIGGTEKSEAAMLSRWSKELLIPTILLSNESEALANSPYAFKVYPDENRLAEVLVQNALKQKLKRIAIVRPQDGSADKISASFSAILKASGGEVTADLQFVPGQFESMSAMADALFHINLTERRDEYKRAYKKAQDDAKRRGVAFNPRMVLLKPIVNFDAIFVPADFRTVRHLAKLFKFHQVDKLNWIGTYQWRSPALIDPYDPFLAGAFFADFIGSYAALPTGIGAVTNASPFFTAPNTVMPIDFRMIGYRVARVASMAMNASATPASTRRSYAAQLSSLRSDSSDFFGQGLIFDAQRQSNWPSYICQVSTLSEDDAKGDVGKNASSKNGSAKTVKKKLINERGTLDCR